MGGNQSKPNNKLDCLADSNSVRQKHDEKVLRREGVKNIGYVPRKEVNLSNGITGSTKYNEGQSKVITCIE